MMTEEEKREQLINFAAGQCALSDKEERPIEWWAKLCREQMRMLEEAEARLEEEETEGCGNG